LAWWISQASILAGLLVPVPVRTAIWITALIWMGTACAGAAGAPISVAWTPFVHHRKEKNAKRVLAASSGSKVRSKENTAPRNRVNKSNEQNLADSSADLN
jgi:hypothetical protein